jgi:peroxiredoxin
VIELAGLRAGYFLGCTSRVSLRLVAAYLELGCLLLLLLWLTGAGAAEQRLIAEDNLQPAPAFHLLDLAGESHRLADYRGQVVIINFWASWCAPCRQELPSMNRAWAVLKSEGVAMLAVNLDEEAEAVKGFVHDFPIDFPVLIDRQGRVSQQWRVRGLPTTFVLNPHGEIVYRVIGEREWDSEALLQQVRVLLPASAVSAQAATN